MKFKLIMILGILSIFGCKNPKAKNEITAVSPTNDIDRKEEIDSLNHMKISSLPILFENSDYLLHPIGTVEFSSKKGKLKSYSSKSYYTNDNFVNQQGESFAGAIDNISFQKIGSSKFYSLSDEDMNIKKVVHIYEGLKQPFLLYVLSDFVNNSTEKKEKLEFNTIYLSHLDGSNFHQITSSNENALEWKVLPETKQLFFSTSDRIINSEDKVLPKRHYYSLNIEQLSNEPEEYFPLITE